MQYLNMQLNEEENELMMTKSFREELQKKKLEKTQLIDSKKQLELLLSINHLWSEEFFYSYTILANVFHSIITMTVVDK